MHAVYPNAPCKHLCTHIHLNREKKLQYLSVLYLVCKNGEVRLARTPSPCQGTQVLHVVQGFRACEGMYGCRRDSVGHGSGCGCQVRVSVPGTGVDRTPPVPSLIVCHLPPPANRSHHTFGGGKGSRLCCVLRFSLFPFVHAMSV